MTRVAYYSPWNPVPSGISDYSEDLVPELAKHFRLDLVRDDYEPASGRLRAQFDFITASALFAEGSAAAHDLVIYQMGNNHHHAGIYAAALRRPGLVALHDFVLHHLLVEDTLARGDRQGYFDEMEYAHGSLGFQVALARIMGIESPLTPFVFPANKRLLDTALGLVVHSDWARREAAAIQPELPIFHVPMGIPPVPGAPERGAARRRLGIRDDAFVVGSFGFITPIKRVEVVLEAIAALAGEIPSIEALVVGSVSPAVPLAERVATLGLEARTRITEHVVYEDFASFIAACDVCVNLRYPSAGETSASLLRIMGMGRAVIVSDYRQFSEFPEDTVARVPIGGGEFEALIATLSRLYVNPAERDRLAASARAFVAAEHSVESAAAGYRLAIESVLERPRSPRPQPFVDAMPTTTVPDRLAAHCEFTAPAEARAGSRIEVRWRLANAGNTLWRAEPCRAGDYVAVAPSLWPAGGTAALVEYAWQRLSQPLGPGGGLEGGMTLRLPPEPGEYAFRLDLVIPGLGRFSELGDVSHEARIRAL